MTNHGGGEHERPHQTKEGVMRRLMLLGLILLGVASCARTQSDPALMAATPPTAAATGPGAGNGFYSPPTPGSGPIKMTMQQTGSKVTGTVEVSGTQMPRSGPISAIVQGNQLQILHPTGVTGSLTVQGDTIKGELGGLTPANSTIKKGQ